MDLEDPSVGPQADDGGAVPDPSVGPPADDGGAVPDRGDTFSAVDHVMATLLVLFTVGLGIVIILYGCWALQHPDEMAPKGLLGGVVLVVEGAVFVLLGGTGCVLLLVHMCCPCLAFDSILQKVLGPSPR